MFWKHIKKGFKELRHLWEGTDGRLSIKRVLGTILFFHLIYIVQYAVTNKQEIQYEILISYVTLIAAFFMLTMVPDIMTKVRDTLKKGSSSSSSSTIISTTTDSSTENKDNIKEPEV